MLSSMPFPQLLTAICSTMSQYVGHPRGIAKRKHEDCSFCTSCISKDISVQIQEELVRGNNKETKHIRGGEIDLGATTIFADRHYKE